MTFCLNSKGRLILGSLLLFIAIQTFAEPIPDTINLAATDWCPYACLKDSHKQGIAYDYMVYIMRQHSITVSVISYPWSRAIQEVKNGHSHGLLTAVPSEAPNLLFTQQPMMNYQMCFFGLPGSRWRFNGSQSLSTVALGVVADYGYGEPLDSFIADYRNTNVARLAGGNSIKRLTTLLEMGRIDALIEDVNVMNWYLIQQNKTPLVKLGCLSQRPFYMALAPEIPWANELIKILDTAFIDVKNKHWLATHIATQYQ